MRFPIALLVSALLLGGCATPATDARLTVGTTSVAQVRALYGQPTHVWPEADGGQTLEYTGQPFGTHCDMLRFDASGRLVARRDGLAPAERAKIVPGMTMEQVQRLIGKERTRIRYERTDEDVLDWNVVPPFSAMLLHFTVYFKDGVVEKTVEILVDPDRPRHIF